MFADYRIANSIAQLFGRIPPAKIKELYERVREEALRRGMDYEEEDGSPRLIPSLLRPRLTDEFQRNYFHKVCVAMNAAFARLWELRCQEQAVKDALPLPPEEEEWFAALKKSPDLPLVNFVRWDANADFSGMRWRGQFSFFEVNGVGVGGIHYSPTLEGIVHDIVFPELQKVDPDLVLCKNDDAREMLLDELARLGEAIGRPKPQLGFVVDMRAVGGPNEFPKLAAFAQQKGFRAVCCDSRDLRLRQGELYHGDFRVDVLYRDTILSEFVAMEKDGEDMSAIRAAFANRQVISSLTGEFDHKSCFEIFSNPVCHRWFSPTQRRFFKRHVLWTRIVSERNTTDSKERKIDLVKYARQRRNQLVLKPNRGFGGVGILVGDCTPRNIWDKAIAKALQEKGEWVVQEKAMVHSKHFPILNSAGRLEEHRLNVVCGFIASANDELAILGRASPARIVNVAQGGGMTAILRCLNVHRDHRKSERF